MNLKLVIPAKAGTQIFGSREVAKNAKEMCSLRAFVSSHEIGLGWVPAFAGMTKKGIGH